MELDDIRRHVIMAIFSDDELQEQLTLKGGNALALVYKLGHRASLDVDTSLAGDFDDQTEASRRLEDALTRRFNGEGYAVFDWKFKDEGGEGPRGGYKAEFKLIDQALFEKYDGDPNKLRKYAIPVNGSHQASPKFKIDISRFENVDHRQIVDMEGVEVPVYTKEMIAIEKLRALCQQMEGYKGRANPKPRPRDFYDLHILIAQGGVDFSDDSRKADFEKTFEIKEVPLDLLKHVGTTREFHRTGWDDVVQSAAGPIESFDFYFEFVLELIEGLDFLWDI